MKFPHASQNHSSYYFSLETQLGPLALAYTLAATRDPQFWVERGSAGLLTRPLGAWVIGGLGDRLGRKPMLLLSFAMIGVASLGVALTPSYASIGVAAPLVVIMFRLIQGFALVARRVAARRPQYLNRHRVHLELPGIAFANRGTCIPYNYGSCLFAVRVDPRTSRMWRSDRWSPRSSSRPSAVVAWCECA